MGSGRQLPKTWAFGTSGAFLRVAKSEAWRLLDSYWSAGGRIFDTATIYGDGEAERRLGAWLRARRHSEAVVVTKVGHPSARFGSTLRSDRILSECQESKRRLGYPHPEGVLLHRDDSSCKVGEVAAWLEGCCIGSEMWWGVSNWSSERIEALVRLCGLDGRFSATSEQLSLVVPRKPLWPGTRFVDGKLWEVHERFQLSMLAWSAQARGWFVENVDDAFRSRDRQEESIDREVRLAVRGIAREHGVSANVVALGWLFHLPFPVVPVLGLHLESSIWQGFEAINLRLSDEEQALLSRLRSRLLAQNG